MLLEIIDLESAILTTVAGNSPKEHEWTVDYGRIEKPSILFRFRLLIVSQIESLSKAKYVNALP
jgi:hypothetical protein